MDLLKRSLPKKYLLLVDFICITITFPLATWLCYGEITAMWFHNIYGAAFVIAALLYIAIYFLYDTYTGIFKRGFLEEFLAVLKINGCLAAVLTAVMYMYQKGSAYSRLFFISFFILNILLTYIARQYCKIWLLSYYKKSNFSCKIMVITTSDQAVSVLKRIRSENDWDYQITYLTVLDRHMVGEVIEDVPVKADFIDMFEVAKQEALDGVFIHIPNTSPLNFDLEETILEFENMGITVNLSINTFGLKLHEKIVREMSGFHVLTFSTRLFDESQMMVKRIVDITAGLLGCIITLLLTVLIAPAIRLESSGPIFFRQVRVGKNGRRFKIYKFRTMYMDAEERKAELMVHNEIKGFMFKVTDDPRVTKVGKFLRKTSLDELPQFLNILKGDMSLVGTRPPTESEFLQYEGRHKRRLALKSGLTGLWQVSGRSEITDFEDVVKLDLEYIDNWSFRMDVRIILRTIRAVLSGRGSK